MSRGQNGWSWDPRAQSIKYKIASFLLLILISFSFFYLVKKPRDLELYTRYKSQGPSLNEVVSGVTPVLRSDLEPLLVKFESRPELKEICLGQQLRIMESSVDQVLEDITGDRFAWYRDCMPLDEELTNDYTVELMYGTCKPLSLQYESGQSDCRMALVSYKAILMDRVIGEIEMEDLNEKVLAHKIISKLALGEIRTASEIEKIERLGLELKKQVPESYFSHKSHIFGLFLKELHPDFRENEEVKKSFDQSINIARRFVEYDKDLKEIDLYVRLYRDEKKSIKRVNEFIERYPEESLGYYYLASAHMRDESLEEALSALEKASQLNPDDMRVERSLESLKAGRTPDFNLGITIGFDRL